MSLGIGRWRDHGVECVFVSHLHPELLTLDGRRIAHLTSGVEQRTVYLRLEDVLLGSAATRHLCDSTGRAKRKSYPVCSTSYEVRFI